MSALRRLRSALGRRLVRYAAVSVASVLVGQVVLAVCFGMLRFEAQTANYTAFAVAAVPSYCLNRAWVWGRSGPSRLIREVLPFCALALAGLALSTWAVSVAEGVGAGLTDARALETLLVMGASLGAVGTVWVGKFLALNLVFASDRGVPHDPRAASGVDSVQRATRTDAQVTRGSGR